MAVPFPELFYVHAKISAPSKLSHDVFTAWYNDVHIPDILATSGIKTAYRYFTLASDPADVERPYLALYPIEVKGFLQSEEFAAIPVKSELLPGPSHEVFDVADFDTRCYGWVGGWETFGGPYLMTVQFEEENMPRPEVYESSALFKCYFAMQNRTLAGESEIGTPPTFLALVWYESEEELLKGVEWSSKRGKVETFKLLKAFTA